MKTIEDEIAEAKSDAITLNFAQWQQQERLAGRPFDHSSWIKKRDAVLFNQKWRNSQARESRLKNLEGLKLARQQENEDALNQELLPQKQAIMRSWLASNFGKTESDFNESAWPHLRANLLVERDESARQNEMDAARLRSRGAYSF